MTWPDTDRALPGEEGVMPENTDGGAMPHLTQTPADAGGDPGESAACEPLTDEEGRLLVPDWRGRLVPEVTDPGPEIDYDPRWKERAPLYSEHAIALTVLDRLLVSADRIVRRAGKDAMRTADYAVDAAACGAFARADYAQAKAELALTDETDDDWHALSRTRRIHAVRSLARTDWATAVRGVAEDAFQAAKAAGAKLAELQVIRADAGSVHDWCADNEGEPPREICLPARRFRGNPERVLTEAAEVWREIEAYAAEAREARREAKFSAREGRKAGIGSPAMGAPE